MTDTGHRFLVRLGEAAGPLTFIFILLFIVRCATAQSQPQASTAPVVCPDVAGWTTDVYLPVRCPAPVGGRLYTLKAHEELAAQTAYLDTLIDRLQTDLARARGERDRARTDAATALDTAAQQVAGLEALLAVRVDPPRRVTWFALGAAVGVLTGVALTSWLE